ncbi:LysR family transcriptional regulator [Dehalobacterium formicoaceticum]|uniref:LysR family transcriptional regulator n=1 Tax=Dehalobacterium formicoaceticum TaxID=51515 RepID=UPI000B7DA949|nr:LysR family transcriptional regulator [Dehalobacterium formicoaceticum]
MYNSRLTTFVSVADYGSFTKAAEKLFISSTAIMKQINSLEKHLNLKLFERTNQGVNLTEAGKVIYKHSKYLFTYSDKAIMEARQIMETAETTFCVGTSILNPCKPFMDLWYQVDDYFPGYKLNIVPFEDKHEGILTEVSALGEKFDFLVAACDSAQWLNRCNFFELGTYQIGCAVPRGHSLASKQQIDITDLYGESLMIVKRGDSHTIDEIRNEIEQNHPQIHIEDTPQFYDMEVFNKCEQTRHPLLTLECWKDVHPSLVTLPMSWNYRLPYGLLYSIDPEEDVLKFLELLKKR